MTHIIWVILSYSYIWKFRCKLYVNDYNRFLTFKLALTTCHESCQNVSNFKSHETIFHVYICIIYKNDKIFDELVLQGGHTHFVYRWWRADKMPQIRAVRTCKTRENNFMRLSTCVFFEMVRFRSKTINLKSFFEYFFGIFGFFSLCRLKVRSPLVYFTERGRVFSVKAECWASPLWKNCFIVNWFVINSVRQISFVSETRKKLSKKSLFWL